MGSPAETTVFGASGGAAHVYAPVVVQSADLLVSLGVDKLKVKQGELLTNSVTVRNFGLNQATDVAVETTLPTGATFVAASTNKGSFSKQPPVGETGTVTWNPGNMASSNQDTAQIRVTVIVRGKDTITCTTSATSSTPDPHLADNTAAITVSVAPGSSTNTGGGKK